MNQPEEQPERIETELPDLTRMPLDELLTSTDPDLLAALDRVVEEMRRRGPQVETTFWDRHPGAPKEAARPDVDQLVEWERQLPEEE